MHILSAEGIAKSYSEKVLFQDISLGIQAGEKIGLIGINGTGKSTLLKVLAGAEPPDAGRILAAGGIRIEYLPQNPVLDMEATVLEQVFKGDSPLIKLVRTYEAALSACTQHSADEGLEKQLLVLTGQMEDRHAWAIESEAKTILTKLGILSFDAKIKTLSGGQRKRAALAGALIAPTDLLILDEPTNHIDSDTVHWLESYLANRRGALLLVTHDRYFLDRAAERMIELDRGRLFSYSGNYSAYLEQKAEREEREASAEEKRQNMLRRELAWIKRGAKARTTKQKARTDRFEKLRDEEAPAEHASIAIETGVARLGRKTIELAHVDKAFDGRNVVEDFSYTLLRDDRIGIIGPNGSGKSTLLNIIAGRLAPDRGSVSVGETVKIGYFMQEEIVLNDSLRVIDYIREEAEMIPTASGSIRASQMLELFLFPPQVQWTQISKLSGGEKRRLYLLRILMGTPNVLLLDEPTNDLDIQTLTILEHYLDGFDGAVIAVSHDRFFLDRVTDKLLSFGVNGQIKQFTGSYALYQEQCVQMAEEEEKDDREAPKKAAEKNPHSLNKGPLKFTYKEQKEYDEIDSVIAALEEQIADIDQRTQAAPADYSMLQDLLAEKEGLDHRLEHAYERWVYLNERAAEIDTNKTK